MLGCGGVHTGPGTCPPGLDTLEDKGETWQEIFDRRLEHLQRTCMPLVSFYTKHPMCDVRNTIRSHHTHVYVNKAIIIVIAEIQGSKSVRAFGLPPLLTKTSGYACYDNTTYHRYNSNHIGRNKPDFK